MKLTNATTISDDNLPLSNIRELIDSINKDRNLEVYHNEKDLIVNINIAAMRLLEFFQWTDKNTELMSEMRKHIKEKLADVLIYSIDLANIYDIDMTEMIMDKLAKDM